MKLTRTCLKGHRYAGFERCPTCLDEYRAHYVAKKRAETKRRAESSAAATHFRQCGPFCQHVVFCEACSEAYGLCEAHQDNPDGSFRWKESSPDDERLYAFHHHGPAPRVTPPEVE